MNTGLVRYSDFHCIKEWMFQYLYAVMWSSNPFFLISLITFQSCSGAVKMSTHWLNTEIPASGCFNFCLQIKEHFKSEHNWTFNSRKLKLLCYKIKMTTHKAFKIVFQDHWWAQVTMWQFYYNAKQNLDDATVFYYVQWPNQWAS
jgi:hypothetical protein